MNLRTLSTLASQQETQNDSGYELELGKRKKEKEPNKRMEFVGGAVAMACFSLVIVLSRLSATRLASGIFFSIFYLAVYWSRQNKYWLIGVAIGVGIIICDFLDKVYGVP